VKGWWSAIGDVLTTPN